MLSDYRTTTCIVVIKTLCQKAKQMTGDYDFDTLNEGQKCMKYRFKSCGVQIQCVARIFKVRMVVKKRIGLLNKIVSRDYNFGTQIDGKV